jgi:hypothetical protein
MSHKRSIRGRAHKRQVTRTVLSNVRVFTPTPGSAR